MSNEKKKNRRLLLCKFYVFKSSSLQNVIIPLSFPFEGFSIKGEQIFLLFHRKTSIECIKNILTKMKQLNEQIKCRQSFTR